METPAATAPTPKPTPVATPKPVSVEAAVELSTPAPVKSSTNFSYKARTAPVAPAKPKQPALTETNSKLQENYVKLVKRQLKFVKITSLAST